MEWWQSSHPPYRLTLFPSSASHLLALLKTLEPMNLPHWLEATLYVAINQILKKGWFYKRRRYVSLAFGCPEEPAWITQGTGEGVDSSGLARFKDFRFVLGRIIRKYTPGIFFTEHRLHSPNLPAEIEQNCYLKNMVLLFPQNSVKIHLLRRDFPEHLSHQAPWNSVQISPLHLLNLFYHLHDCGFMEGGPRLYYLLALTHPWFKFPTILLFYRISCHRAFTNIISLYRSIGFQIL